MPNPFRPGLTETIEIERHGERRTVEVAGSPLHFDGQVEDFIRSVLDGAPPVVSLADSRRVAAALAMLGDAVSGARA